MTTTKVPQKSYITTEHRYLSALHDIQASGVLVFDNYPSCCGSCTFAEIDSNHPGTDHVSFHNSQGRALKFKDGMPYNYETDMDSDDDEDDDYPYGAAHTEEKPATKLYWSHSTLKAAQAASDAFMRHGFTVDWDGTENKCVTIVF